jgi:hypothetical protein
MIQAKSKRATRAGTINNGGGRLRARRVKRREFYHPRTKLSRRTREEGRKQKEMRK